MGNMIKWDDNKDIQLPAHLRALADQGGMDDWASGQVSGFPVLSVKGKVFHIVRGEDAELITRPDDPDEAATSLQLVVLKTHKGVARVFYSEKYEEGSQDKPTCYSNDGITPEDDAEEKQAKQCKVCPHSQWGSRITDSGKKGKACSEVKRLAVAEPGYEDDPMLLRVPPTSLRNWDEYLRKLAKKGIKPNMLVTKVGFDATVSHQLLTFKPVGFLDAEGAARVAAMDDNDVVEAIIGASPVINGDGEGAEDAEEAPEPPRERTRASRKTETDEEEDEKPARRQSRQEEDEEAPAPSRRRRTTASEEKPASRRRAAPKDEEEEPAPRRRRPSEADEETDEKPATRRRREPEEEDEPEVKKSAQDSATVVDADDDLEGELNDMLGDLDFDDD